jgi:hypothetical protein
LIIFIIAWFRAVISRDIFTKSYKPPLKPYIDDLSLIIGGEF